MNRCWAGYAFFAMLLILSLGSMLSACGVKGALYLPAEEQTGEASSSEKPQKEQAKQ